MFHLLNSIGFAHILPISLALFSKISPEADHGDGDRPLLSGLLHRQRGGRLCRRPLFVPADDDLLADPRRQRRVRAGRLHRLQAGARPRMTTRCRGAGRSTALSRERRPPLVLLAMADVATDGLKHALEAERAIEPGGNLRASWEALFKEARGCTRCDSTSTRRRPCSARARSTRRSCSSASSRATRRTSPGGRSSGRPGRCSTRRWRKRGSTARPSTSPMRSSISSSCQRGKQRIHSKPDAGEIEACRWWIEQERALIRPPVTVALGATAARSLLGKIVTIGSVRGAPHALPDGGECWVTVHPSFLLRIPEPERKREERALFVARPQAHQGTRGGAGGLEADSRASP